MVRLIRTGICLLLFAGSVQSEVLRQDLASLFTLKNTGVATLGLGLAGMAYPWDDDSRKELKGAILLGGPADITNVYGSSSFNLPFSLGLWGLGKATRRDQLEKIGADLIRTLAYTQLVVAPVKIAVRRERPDHSNRLSFPSGHTANGFAIARLFHRHYGLGVGAPLYIVGGFVAAGRIEDDRHFLSDVVMGAVLGTLVGNSVTLERKKRAGVVPRLTRDGVLLTFVLPL